MLDLGGLFLERMSTCTADWRTEGEVRDDDVLQAMDSRRRTQARERLRGCEFPRGMIDLRMHSPDAAPLGHAVGGNQPADPWLASSPRTRNPFMKQHHFIRQCLCAAAFFVAAPLVSAQSEGTLLQIAQSGIGSNGFSTTWRGQTIALAEDAWLTRIVFQTGSASVNVDEIRLMTDVPALVTLEAVTNITRTNSSVEAVLSQPYLLRGGERYTAWFHQTGSPNGTSGCDLTVANPTWRGYHTNVDPTQAPGPGEPGYFWAYQYGTNMSLIGHDNLELTNAPTIGGNAQIQLDAPPNINAALLFSLGAADFSLSGFVGPLRLDPSRIVSFAVVGTVAPNGTWLNTFQIPLDPTLRGLVVYAQGLYSFTSIGATFSPLEIVRIS